MHLNKKFLGIEIGGTKLQLVKADARGRIEERLRYAVDAASGRSGICRQLEEALHILNAANSVAAIGVGFGGPVDTETGIVQVSHQVKDWAGFPLAQWLHAQTGKPVSVDNDANTAALAEALHGTGKKHRRVFYMTIGSGIGGGLIVAKKIYHGRSPGEVEVGHLRLTKRGETLEEKCSGWAVDKKIRACIEQEPNGLLAQLSREQPEGPEAKLLQTALEQGDETAQKIMAELSDDLAFALSHVVHLFHPDVLIIGGGLSLLKQHLLQPLMQRLPVYVMQAFCPPPPLALASLEEDVVPVGAVELAKQIFQKRTRFQNV